MFWPSGLSYYYPHPGNRLAAWAVLASALLLIAITAAVWRYRERRHLVFGWELFVVTLLPVIGIVQVGLQAMADRYAYIPLIGLFVMIVWELSEAAGRWHVPTAAQAAVAALLAVALSVVTVINTGYWHDSVTLYRHAREVIPFANTRIETNLGAALLDAGRAAEAIEHFTIAESLAPNMFVPHFNIGYALARSGDNSHALPELQEALRTAMDGEEKTRALNSLAVAFLDLGENDQAEQAFSQLLKLQPNSLAGRAGRGQAFYNLRRYEQAGADFVAASELKPAPQLFLMAGKSLEGAGKLAEAEAAYREALAGNAGLTEARERLHLLEQRLAPIVSSQRLKRIEEQAKDVCALRVAAADFFCLSDNAACGCILGSVCQELRMKTFICLALLLVSPALAQQDYNQLLRHWDYDQSAPLHIKQAGVQERDGITIYDISFSSPVGDRRAAVGPNGGVVSSYLVVPPGKGAFSGSDLRSLVHARIGEK